MLHHELVGGPLGQSVTVVEPYDSSTRDEKHDTPFHDGETDTYVVPTKGSHELAAKSFSKHNNDNYDNCDAKTVTTATSDLLVTDGASTSGESFSCSSYQERQGPFSELDWSFLRDGELFDRQEQQKKLLDVFYRQMSMGTTITDNTTSDNYNHERDEDHDNKNQRFQSIRSKCSTLNRASLSGRNKEMVIVSGLSGTGKTTLVEETLKRPVVQSGGYFLCGKLDQLNKDKSSPQRPYAPFVMAFSHLVDSVVMNKGVAEEIRACVCSKMTNRDIDLILETFPSLARIIRPQESSNGYDGSTISKNKMNGTMLARVVRIFLESICDPQTRPIVLLIDDLQWADQGTLVLLNSLLSETEDDRNTGTNGLLLVGTCRHNEVTVDDELALLLRTLEDEENVSICQIEVSNLSRPVSGELFARVLGVPREKYTPEIASSLDPLVDIAYEQTKGNVFFLLQFMRSLHDEGYLRVEAEPQKLAQINITSSSAQQTNNWLWSEKAIRSSSIHDAMSAKKDAVSILARQMKRLPSHEQNTLMVASCLGSKFDKDLLHMAMPAPANEGYTYSPEMLSRSLELLVEKDFVRIDTGSGHYQFCHDKIQQAAIALIKDSKRALFCTNIGRRILERTQSSKNENIFLIVNFFSHGISEGIITDRSERMMVATLALEAGETASSMSDYATSATYLSLGISCLQSNFIGIRNGYWKDEYDFSLTIYNAAAEVEYCTANFERMDALIKEILLNARQFHDKMRAYVTMINSLGTRERLLEAIAQGFSLLECLGEPFHTKDLKIFLLFDLIKTKRMLKNFDSDFERSPQMKDKDKLAAMEILNIIFPYCTMLKHPKAPHAIFRMVQLTVKYGVTATSATGFAGYGMGLCGIGDFLNGNRYGKIALRLLDHFEAKQLTCRVYCIYYGFVSNWNRPLAMNLEPVMDAHRIGLSTGDIDFAGASANVYATNSFHAGKPLDVIDLEVSKLVELLILFRQTAARSVISPILQHVYNLRGGNDFDSPPWILTGYACDEETLMAEAKASNNIMCLSQFNFRKLWMAYVFNNYEYAFTMAEKSRVTIKSSPSSFFVFSHYFFEGMTCLALARSPNTKLRKKKKYERLAKRCLKTMKKYTAYCKRNCLNKFLMLKAELLVTKGDLSGGLELFEQSASCSKEEGFMHEQAIAFERAGLAVLHGKGLADHVPKDTASKYFTKAMSLYQLWGAISKVDQMIQQGYKME